MWKPIIPIMNTPIKFQQRVGSVIDGMPKTRYEDKENSEDFCSWKGMGGSEAVISGVLEVEDTAVLTMWFRPDVNVKDIILLYHESPYEIVNVENVELRNQIMILKVRRVVNA